MQVRELADHPLMLPDLDVEAVKMAACLLHREFVALRLEFEAVDDVALTINGIGAVLSHGGDSERLAFLESRAHFPSFGLRVKTAEPSGNQMSLGLFEGPILR